MTVVTLSEDAFAEIYKPIRNPLDANASFDFGEGYGTLFETYGEEFEFVRGHEPPYVWTLLSGDDGDFIGSGLRFVNRLGYFITEVAVPEGIHFEIDLEW